MLKAPDAKHHMSETNQRKSRACIESISTINFGYCRGVVLGGRTHFRKLFLGEKLQVFTDCGPGTLQNAQSGLPQFILIAL